MDMYWLGIDVGTGGTRALLVDASGKVRHSFTSPHEDMRMECPLWAEQRPENWWDAATLSIRGVLDVAGASGKDIRGIGLSGQMHGLVLLDSANEVIRPALIWCDQRSQAQVDSINTLVGKETVVASIANPVLTGFTLPKFLWVRDNEPAIFARVRKILLPKDYLRFQLTCEHACDVSDASGTALFDVVRRRWSSSLADQLGIDRSILPSVLESPEISGKVSRAAAAVTGLMEGVSYSQKDGLEIIQNMGVRVNSVRVSGGGARSSFWRQMLADVFNLRVAVLESEEGSAYGAALLAMVGTGEYSSVIEVCKAAVREVGFVEPRSEESAIYASGHRVYQSLYPKLVSGTSFPHFRSAEMGERGA